MKNEKWLMRFVTVLALFLSINVLPGFSQTPESAEPSEGDLVVQLKLTEEQIARVEEIFNMAQSQAEKDRESFKGNSLGLIQAARRRREMTDNHIGTLLTPEQKELFENLKKARKRNEEFFILREGLLLTPAQSIRVEQVLDETRKEFAAVRGRGRGAMGGMRGGMGDEMGGGMGGGMRGGGMRGGGMRGGPGGMSGMRGGRNPMMDAMKKREGKKAKRIKKLLTKEQKEMYKDIRKMQKAEMKQRMEEMLKRMRTNMNR